MSRKRLGAVAAAVMVAAGGTGTAIAVTKGGEGKKSEDAVIEGAAERLDVTPQKLREALSAAQDDQLDAAVKAGRLSQAQADEIKKRRKESGRVLGGPGIRRGGPFGAGRGGPPGMRGGGPPGHRFKGGMRGHMEVRGIAMQELAKALGVTRTELREALRDGKSIADIAKAEGRSLDAVKTALKAAAKTRLAEAVTAKRLTQAQADRIAPRLNRMIDRLDEFPALGKGPRRLGPP